MDEQVLRSLVKWPNVPDCYGWLALDRRGQWRMRDEYAQNHSLSGTVIKHAALNESISRNYAHDDLGRYFFQNGPQRVFITLDATPWIARFIPSDHGTNPFKLLTHCGTSIDPQGALSDESGNIYIVGAINQLSCTRSEEKLFTKEKSISIALLHDHDLHLFSDQSKILEDACSYKGSWMWNGEELPVDPIYSAELSERFHFTKKPQATT